MRAALVWIALLSAPTGCGFTTPLSVDGGPADRDAARDAQGLDACVPFAQHVTTCGSQPTGASLMLDGMYRFDTDTGVLSRSRGTAPMVTTALVTTTTNLVEVRAWYVGELALAANTTVRVVGARPLAIVATGAVTLGAGAVIDVSDGGAGARTTCPGGPAAGEGAFGGAAGGGGGAFGGAGGRGANGNSDNIISDSSGGAGGTAGDLPLGPLGGCPGAAGGTGSGPAGRGGRGGGAIYVVSAVGIELATTAGINAGGGGGDGGGRGDAGGGGGGSGGMILVEAPRITGGLVAANGGGGGEGSDIANAGAPGSPGTLGGSPAAGGTGGAATGATGWPGGAATMLAGTSGPTAATLAGGGGGGGGGVGIVRVVSPMAQLGTTSPASL